MDGMGWYISGCGIAIHNIKIQIRQGTMTRAHTYDTLVHFQPHIKPLMPNIWGNNLISDGTICNTLCSAQLKKEIYTYLHIVVILDLY